MRLNGIDGVTATPAMVNDVAYFGNWTVSYISWNAPSPSAEDRLTVSQRSVQKDCRLQRHRNESVRGAQPSQSDRDESADRGFGR